MRGSWMSSLEDDDVAGRLEDLVVAAVPAPDAVPPARDAAGPGAEVGVGVGRVGRPPRAALGALGLDSRAALRRQRGDAPVRRVDDERRPGQGPAHVAPERVVVAHAALGRRQVEAGPVGRLDGLRLLERQRSRVPRGAPRPAARAGSRSGCSTAPAGRVAPGRAGRCRRLRGRGLAGGRRGRRRDRDQDQCGEPSLGHGVPPELQSRGACAGCMIAHRRRACKARGGVLRARRGRGIMRVTWTMCLEDVP